MFTSENWAKAVSLMTEIKFKKNDVVIAKGTRKSPLNICLLLSTEAVCNNSTNPFCYVANSVI